MSGTSTGAFGFPVPSQQSQPKVLVVWSEGKTSTVRADDEDDEASHGQKDAGWKPLPFQYQIPINKYSTLHNIAVKRSAVRRGQKDIDNHRTTIAIPKYETVSHLIVANALPITGANENKRIPSAYERSHL